jgi:ribosomal-protein-alanine N-acetyltransferase
MATTERAAISASLNISINRMVEHDLLEVCAIEQMSELSAWGWDAYHKEMQSGAETIMLVARTDSTFQQGEIAGFIVARLIADEVHVNNVAVRPEFRDQHLGSRLLRTALQEAKQKGATVARLEVRAGNHAAQRLYRRCGFEVDGRRKAYYRGPTEDALLMSLALSKFPGTAQP